MPEFKKPKVLKKAVKVLSEDESVVVEISHLAYVIGDKEYPKLHLRVWNQDDEGFPISQPKQMNLPIAMQERIAKALMSFK